MKKMHVFAMALSALFCAAMAAGCVGSADPEGTETSEGTGGEDAPSTPGIPEGPGETTEAYCAHCHVYCLFGLIYSDRGAHSDCQAEGQAYCKNIGWPFDHAVCYQG